MGALLATALYWTFRNVRPATASNGFRHAQTVSAALMAFSHGSNDAQKTMGVISLALLAAGTSTTSSCRSGSSSPRRSPWAWARSPAGSESSARSA